MIGPLATHVALGEAIELGVHEGREFLECLLLAVAPRFQELRQFVSPRLVHLGSGIYHIAGLQPQIFSHKKAQKHKIRSEVRSALLCLLRSVLCFLWTNMFSAKQGSFRLELRSCTQSLTCFACGLPCFGPGLT